MKLVSQKLPFLTLSFASSSSRTGVSYPFTFAYEFSSMSWMDSWSRPSKQSAIPPPLYLTSDDVKYCSTCGRVIGARRSHQKNKIVKYCSDGCRNHRPGPLDKRIDRTILSLLLDEEDSGLASTNAKARFKKGDKRLVITCNEIENIVFNRDASQTKENDDESDDANDADGVSDKADDDPADESDSGVALANDDVGTRVTAKPSTKSDEEPSQDSRRQEGQRRADEREKVRRAARRAVVFGFLTDSAQTDQPKAKPKSKGEPDPVSEEVPRRKCEALVNGRVVEPSFAKGNWSIRWRE